MSTHIQALSALLFRYRELLDITQPWLADIQRRPRRIPSVLTMDEVRMLLAAMDGEVNLLARLLCGACMHLS